MSVDAVIVMAAGLGTRMKSAKPKVLHEIAGRSMIAHAVIAASAVSPERLVVVLGHGREQVQAHLEEVAPEVSIAVQEQMLGTGDAAKAGLGALEAATGEIVITSGDVPLLRGETLVQLVQAHREGGYTATVLTAQVPDPTGYGRIVRDGDLLAKIVEEKDATEAEQLIDEVNGGIYVFAADALREALEALQPNNAQGEYYLTDAIAYIAAQGGRVGGAVLRDYLQLEGVNDRVQLAARAAELNRRICTKWMLAGVTILDPRSTWIDADVSLAADVTLLPDTFLQGATSVATGAVIGPETTLKDVEVGEGAQITRSTATLAIIEAGASVGPYSYLRPGTQVGADGKVGAFVEAKNARIGKGAKVPHLTYCGDAEIGAGANIGAGTIFANWDGSTKATTSVGEHAFIGSNSVLVAPVNIGAGAFVAAGSAVTEDVEAGALAVARGRQHISPDWVREHAPGWFARSIK
ncbi:MAG: bifunctional UDP-N-acetylglucosamine diphosphorylase/glucosamine-1-phosphate N-acetyltransferase GlmU [Propionibacteriaceae bacterium]|jgi:bifunctional UDP-N-acetylglucosamine pyrophosphorylase/glucosamine-1-phosphate N-acetyltransferase|nr:bifunctional UDP-N-acetylglucosamine diphosphorylase/glucosamine-1-phosphate N-acetyltransferase GlmU [Propionibacteriaceae bacterium]